MYNGCILRYGIIIFHKNEPPLPEVKHPGSGFFALDNSNFIPTLFQLYSNFIPTIRNFRTVQNYPGTVQLSQSLIYQVLDYQITDVIQLNRAKFIFNRAEKRKPECYCNNIQVHSGLYIGNR